VAGRAFNHVDAVAAANAPLSQGDQQPVEAVNADGYRLLRGRHHQCEAGVRTRRLRAVTLCLHGSGIEGGLSSRDPRRTFPRWRHAATVTRCEVSVSMKGPMLFAVGGPAMRRFLVAAGAASLCVGTAACSSGHSVAGTRTTMTAAPTSSTFPLPTAETTASATPPTTEPTNANIKRAADPTVKCVHDDNRCVYQYRPVPEPNAKWLCRHCGHCAHRVLVEEHWQCQLLYVGYPTVSFYGFNGGQLGPDALQPKLTPGLSPVTFQNVSLAPGESAKILVETSATPLTI
jgi:hypothetical protein